MTILPGIRRRSSYRIHEPLDDVRRRADGRADAVAFGAHVRSAATISMAVHIAAAMIAASIVIGWTRGVWLATRVASLYLIAMWRPKYLLLAPLACCFWVGSSRHDPYASAWSPSINLMDRSIPTGTGTSHGGPASR